MDYIQQLLSIQKASGWSQEQVAHNLGVSFATLNSWINTRSTPRKKARRNIEKLFLSIIGTENIDEETLFAAKKVAATMRSSSNKIANDTVALEKLTLHLTYHTNTIEGSTMTLSDVENVLFEHKVLANRTAVEQAEARNHQAALFWLLDELNKRGDSFVIDEGLILGIHLRLMNGIISDAGQYRKHSVRILGSHVMVANWVKIPLLITELTMGMQANNNDVVSSLAHTHAQFEQIHPFSDGNGRTGRLIMLAQALQSGTTPPLVLKERKYAYYKYLEMAQSQNKYAPLQLFIAESIIFTDSLLKDDSTPTIP